MKKLLLLILMTLLSATAVDAAQVKLRLSGNNQEDLIKENGLDMVGSTWVYKCNGSDLTKYVSNNKMYVRANVNQDGTYEYYVTGKSYSNSGDTQTFFRYQTIDSNAQFATLNMPSNYQNMDFTFTFSDLWTTNQSGYQAFNIKLKIEWKESSSTTIYLNSTFDAFNGTLPAKGSGTSADPYTWTWSAERLNNMSLNNNDPLYFYLSDENNNYGYDYQENVAANGHIRLHVTSNTNLYVWNSNGDQNGGYPGNSLEDKDADGNYYKDFALSSLGYILSNKNDKNNKSTDISISLENDVSQNLYVYWDRNTGHGVEYKNPTTIPLAIGGTGDLCFGTKKTDNANWDKKFYVPYEKGYTYTVEAYKDTSLNLWKIKVTKTGTPIVQLESTIDAFAGTSYQSLKDGVYSWTWSKQLLRGVASNAQLQFNLDVNDTNYGPSGSNTQINGVVVDGTTIRVKCTDNNEIAPYIYAWDAFENKLAGNWPGTKMTQKVDGYWTLNLPQNPINVIISRNGDCKSADLETLYGIVTYEYDGSNGNANKVDTDDGWSDANSNNNKFYFTHSAGQTYEVQAKKVNNQWKVRVIVTQDDYDYYWVSPEITNNQKWEYFKMVPSRRRSGSHGDGKTSDKYFSFTIKDDDLKKWDGSAWSEGTNKISWYIVREDEKKWFRPTVEDLDHESEKGSVVKPGNDSGDDADFYSYNYNSVGITSPSTKCFKFDKGNNKSYTFILNAKPSSGTGNVYVDSPKEFAPTDVDYELVGNFTDARGDIDIDLKNSAHKKSMTKLWYKDNGTAYPYSVESPDSIVYEVKVDRPKNGWGDLYLDINKVGSTDWSDLKKLGDQYRPLISLGNELDGRSLVGGLTSYNSNQSLNPEPSDFYSGYTFRFNATTMTYHLEFHTSLYLVGDAVTADGKGGNWDISDNNNLIPLKATQDPRHFRNTVTFINGAKSGTNYNKGFRFLLKEDENATPTYKVNWGEDSNAPRWASLAESEPHYCNNGDTQYKNYLLYTENGANSSSNPSGQGNNIIFDLPDVDENGSSRTYVINFYNYGDASYYTIEREAELRDYNEVIYKNQRRYILGRGETGTGDHNQRDFTNAYKHFCVWSDYIAWNKPEDVDVYTVTKFQASGTHTATITLTKQDIKYIPAKKAVILAMKTDKDKLKSGMVYDALKGDLSNNTGFNRVIMDMTPYAEPGTTVSSGVPNFKPQYESIVLPYSEGDMYNYLFGFFHANHVVSGNLYDDQDFLLGFWKNTGRGYTYPNSGYLQLSKTDAEMLGVGASGITATEGGAGAPAFLLLFDDEDPSIVTGIRDLDTEVPSVKDSVDDHWYTLSGVRIAQPTAKGIYIHGGKKVIVR